MNLSFKEVLILFRDNLFTRDFIDLQNDFIRVLINLFDGHATQIIFKNFKRAFAIELADGMLMSLGNDVCAPDGGAALRQRGCNFDIGRNEFSGYLNVVIDNRC